MSRTIQIVVAIPGDPLDTVATRPVRFDADDPAIAGDSKYRAVGTQRRKIARATP